MENEAPKKSTKFGKGNPGKPKGAVMKTTRIAKEVIAFAADKLGGAERLVSWAQEDPQNEKAFWVSIYPRLLPLQVTGEDGDPIKLQTTVDVGALTFDQLRALAAIQIPNG